MTKKKGEFTVLRNIRAGMVIILLIYIGLIFQSKGDSDCLLYTSPSPRD